MKFIDFIKEKVLKIPLVSSIAMRFSSGAGGFTSRNISNYYTGWVYLAVSTIAQEVAGIKLKLFKMDSKGNEEQIFKHPALDLLKTTNNFMTQYDLFERLQSNQELKGNEYWYLSYAGKEPENIYPLPSGSIQPVRGKYEYVTHYLYYLDGEKIQIPLQNIVHFKNFNPDSDVDGFPTLNAAMIAADTDNSARFYNKKYFDNDARPDVILEFPESLSPEDERRLIESWNQNHSGPQRQFRTAVASGGLKINSFQISQRDMEYLQGRQFNRDEIMAIFRVPLTVAGFTGNETYASAKAALYSFQRNTIKPKMTRIVNTLNEHYLTKFANTEGMYFEFSDPVLEDRNLVLTAYESGIRNGWLSINDVRRAEDLSEIENGEQVYIPFNVQPLGEPAQSKEINQMLPMRKTANEIVGIIKKSFSKKEMKEEKTDQEKAFDTKGEFMVKQRNERGLEFEAGFNRILEELWTGQKQRAINNLKSALAKKDWKANAPKVLDPEREVKTTIDLFTPLFTQLVINEGISAYDFLGITTGEDEIITPNLTKFITSNTKKFAGSITEDSSKKLRATIAAGLEQGESIADLEKRILESTAFSPARAEKIARTETIRAQGKADLEVWKQTGVVEGKIWYTALDERTCPFCEPLHGKRISLGDSYFKKGETHTGSDGSTIDLDYENVDAPPIHPQCRCVLIPEIKT